MQLIPTEHQECAALKQWADFHPICRNYLLHIANEGKRSLIGGRLLKMEGLRPGVSDYLLAYPSNGKHGLWLEMKRIKGSRVNENQSIFQENMRKVGYEAHIAYGWQEGKNIITNYLQVKNE